MRVSKGVVPRRQLQPDPVGMARMRRLGAVRRALGPLGADRAVSRDKSRRQRVAVPWSKVSLVSRVRWD